MSRAGPAYGAYAGGARIYPGFLVQAFSTLFSKVLGFEATDYGTGGDTQNTFLHGGRLWTAGREVSVRNLEADHVSRSRIAL